MKPIKVGDVTISSHVEQEAPVRTAGALFPTATPDRIARALAELPDFTFDATEHNKLVLAYQSFVLRTPTATVLIDSCVGKHSYAPTTFSMKPYLDSFAAAGVTFEEIDYVFCTHMRVDHVGWHTRMVDGRLVPTFPNAKYIFARSEYEAAAADTWVFAKSIFDECIRTIVDAGQAVVVDDDFVLNDNLRLLPSPGHSPGHVCVELTSGGQRAIFSGDMLHHPIHCLEPDWYTIFCSHPALAVATRREFLKTCANTDTLFFPAHFNGPTAGVIEPAGKAWRYRYVDF